MSKRVSARIHWYSNMIRLSVQQVISLYKGGRSPLIDMNLTRVLRYQVQTHYKSYTTLPWLRHHFQLSEKRWAHQLDWTHHKHDRLGFYTSLWNKLSEKTWTTTHQGHNIEYAEIESNILEWAYYLTLDDNSRRRDKTITVLMTVVSDRVWIEWRGEITNPTSPIYTF